MKKIKKTYGTSTIPENKIFGSKTNSDTDTYNCNYINKVTTIKKLLWENPTPDALFSPQQISITDEKCKMVCIKYKELTEYNFYNYQIVQIGEGALLSTVRAIKENKFRIFSRNVIYGIDNNITFESGERYFRNTDGYDVWDGVIIPVAIYGLYTDEVGVTSG